MQAHSKMNVIGNSADSKTITPDLTGHSGEVSMEQRANILIENRQTILSAEDDVNQSETQRLGHGADYMPGFQPSPPSVARTWGFATCCYMAAPLALMLSLTLGCKSNPSQVSLSQLPKDAKATFVSIRPTTPPPPFKLFHQSKDTLTLVTDEHATDEQIEAIVWQLHDASQSHTFDKLHLPQKAIDARDPIMFFHIYRGAKCAAEKYAPGEPPCGGSYHAAGDYTLGSFKNPNRDDGVLLHDETHQVELWNADGPSNP